MPWDAKSFRERHNHSLSDAQAARAARIANGILKSTGNERLAIATANKRARQKPKEKPKAPDSKKLYYKSDMA